jgi:hypothetical protein
MLANLSRRQRWDEEHRCRKQHEQLHSHQTVTPWLLNLPTHKARIGAHGAICTPGIV